jgi:hypothetical protein
VDVSYLAALETGRRRCASSKVLEKLCVALDLPPGERQAVLKLAALGELTESLRHYKRAPEVRAMEALLDRLRTMQPEEIRLLVRVADAIVQGNESIEVTEEE